MSKNREKSSKSKVSFHPRNKHQGKYDIKGLEKTSPELSKFVIINAHGNQSIDFSNPEAVKALNKSLLKSYYDVEWDIPDSYLCPPIPGRADYIHHVAELLSHSENISKKGIKCLDIGVGANCIYPIIGIKEYDWSFVGTDIDAKALESAQNILSMNPELSPGIEPRLQLRLQESSTDIFNGIIQESDQFDVTICNPPFHTSQEEALKGSSRKVKNLTGNKVSNPTLNFGGKSNELWCEGGEVEFVRNMIIQSKEHARSCVWFTTIVSKEANLKHAYKSLKQVNPSAIKTISIGQGQKKSRVLVWSFQAL
jgi:23S rRNA (adenine1618-N6)-methyltransferase